MSMAMTTVLPDPVAILKAMRGRPGFEVSFASRSVVLDPGVAVLLGDLGDVDGGLEGFDLAEEQLLLAVGVVSSIASKPGGGRRYADVSAFPPDARCAAGCG